MLKLCHSPTGQALAGLSGPKGPAEWFLQKRPFLLVLEDELYSRRSEARDLFP